MDTESNQLSIPGTEEKDPTLGTIIRLSKKLASLADDIEAAEAALKKQQEEYANLAEKLLPDVMMGVGLTELKLVDGRMVTVKPEYYASIAKDRMEAAADWLKANGMGGVVKGSLTVAVEHQAKLAELVVPFQINSSVHPSTLKALVKEQVEADNKEFPRELFGVHVVNRAVLKNR